MEVLTDLMCLALSVILLFAIFFIVALLMPIIRPIVNLIGVVMVSIGNLLKES